MYDSELSDFSDDDDYDALIQQGSASMYRSDSGTQSVPDGAETVFVKDNVTIHPTQYASEGISGRLRLFKQGDSLFMTWIPYKGRSSNERLSDKDKNLYSIRDLPFSNVRSICGHFRRMSWQYVILVTSSGIAYPTFYFYSGGVREFLATIKQHVSLVRSLEDANLFLVNAFQNPLQRTLPLDIHGSVSVGNLPSPTSVASGAVSTDFQEENDKDMNSRYSEPQTIGKQRQKHHDPARELSIQVLEKFSHVTRFAREATSQIFGESFGDVFASHETKHSQLIPMNQPVSKDTSRVNEVSTAPSSREMDKLSLVWGKPRQSPLALEEWNTFFDSEGRVLDSLAARKRIFYGGVEHNLRNEVWPFLLEFYSYDSTFAEREYLMSVKKTEYETLKMQWQSISKDQAKRFTKFRERKSLIEKDVVRTDSALSFYDGDDNPNVGLLHDILLTHSFYNFDLGYCQGMSDLLSPILYVMRDEAQSFWCFASLMERLGPNFNRDQSGMHSQLFALSKLVELLDTPLHNYFKQTDCLNYFFCFRWILIQFKREFDYDSTMRLWEVLWTHYPSEHLHLYTCVAILRRYRNKIIREQMTFDALLKFINELSSHIDLDSIIRDAEALCICAGENGAALIPPGTPPSLPIVDPDASIYQPIDDDEVL